MKLIQHFSTGFPSIQIKHFSSNKYWAENQVGAEYVKGAFAYLYLLLQNGWLPNGINFPVENIEPLFTFFAAVFRTGHKGFPEGDWQI